MAKAPDTSRTKARKGRRASSTGVEPDVAAPMQAVAIGEARPAKAGKPVRSERVPAGATGRSAEEPASKSGRKAAEKSTGKSGKRLKANEIVTTHMPVVTRAAPADAAGSLPDVAVAGKTASKRVGKIAGKAGKGAARRPPRQTFLVAATLVDAGAPRLGVYAAVTRTPGEALAAVRNLLGADVPVGLTGKLSGRMTRALGFKPGEVRRI